MGLDFMRPLRAAGVVSTVAVAFSACQQPTQITLEINTDLDCTLLEPETAIVVGTNNAESTTPGTTTFMCSGGRIGAIVLLPKSEKNEKISVRVVTGVGTNYSAEDCLRNPDLQDDYTEGVLEGCIIARRTLNFIPSTPLFLPVRMRGICLGKPCEPNSTCSMNRQCIPSQIPDPDACGEPDGCELPGDGPADGGSGGQGGAGSTSSSSSMGGMGGMGGNGGSAGMASTSSSSSSNTSSSSSSNSSSSSSSNSSSSNSSTGMGGTGGMGGSGGDTGTMSSSTGMGGTGGMGGMGGMGGDVVMPDKDGGLGGMGGMGGMGGDTGTMSSSTGMAGPGGMGGMGGDTGTMSSSTGMGGTGGMGGMGGDTGTMSSSTGMGGLGTAGMGTAGLPIHGGNEADLHLTPPLVRGWTTKGEEVLIPPGYLIPGQHYALAPRRSKPRRTPLSLPLHTHPRNVKP